MKTLRFSVALVLLLSMLLCAVIPAHAETLSNAGDVSASFTYVAFEMEAVDADGNPTVAYGKGDTVKLNIALFGITGSTKTQLTTPKVKITIDSDDGTTVTQTVDMTDGLATYTFTAMDVAGWQRIRLRAFDANGNDLTGTVIKEYAGGITVDQDNITTSISKPDDFESWWANVIATELDTCPPEVISVEQIDNGTYLAYRVYVTAPTLQDSEHQFLKSGDTYVAFHLSFPKDAAKGSCSIKATYQGYNMGTGGYWGGTANTISVNVNAHSTTLHETHTYDELTDWEKGSSGKYGWDATRTKDRETHYFKYMILRDLQAIRFAQLCFGPEGYNKTVDGVDFSQFKGLWDRETVHVTGSSQGGFQATAMAALCPEVTSCATSMTWLCDVAGNYVNSRVMSSFRPVRSQNTDGRYGLDYFDSTFFATMIDCPYTLTVVGTGDVVAPVSGILALYNNLDVPVKSIMYTQGRDHMTSSEIWKYHNYFGSPDETFNSVKEGGITVWKLDDGALKITGVNTLTAALMEENGWNDIKANVKTIHLSGFTDVAAGAIDLTGSKVHAIGINSSTMTLESGAIVLGSSNIDLATPASSTASAYSATGITQQTLKDGRYYVKLSTDAETLTVCVFYGDLTSAMLSTEATANAATVTTLEIKGNPFSIDNIADATRALTSCTTILFDADAETLAPISNAWKGLFGGIDALTTVAHVSDWSAPSYTEGVVDLRGFEYVYANSGAGALQGLFYDCTAITEVIMPNALYLYNGSDTVKDSNGNPIEVSGATYYIQFSGCTSLAKITWNRPLGNLAEGAFFGCSVLTDVIAPSISEDFYVFMGTGTYINGLTNCAALTITTESGTVIGKIDSNLNAFYVLSGDVLKVYRLKTSSALAQAGSDAFSAIPATVDTSAVTTMYLIGSNTTSVGQITNAFFSKMPALETILMDSRMDSIASYFCLSAAGSKLSTFAHVTFDDATNEISGSYEKGTIDLRGFKYLYTTSTARYKLNSGFAINTQAEKIYLPTSLVAANWNKTPTLVDDAQVECAAVIGAGSFSGNSKLTHLIIPATVTTIEANAFKDCVLLETIDMSGVSSDLTIDSTAFTNVASSTSKKYAIANLPDSAQTAVMKAALGDITTVRAIGSATVAPSLSAEGHAVRTESYTGFRSIFAFDSGVIAANEATGLTLSEYGALLIAQKNFGPYCNSDELTLYELGVAGSAKVKYVPVYKMVDNVQKGYNRYLSVENGIYTYCVTLTEIETANYKDDIYSCAYAKWVDEDGNEYFEFVHYTDTLGQESRSLYDVTAAAYKMGVVNSELAPDFDTIIWPVLAEGAVTIDGFKYLNVPYYSYTWYSDKAYTSPVTNVNGSLNYYPGNDAPTESGIVWSLIEYGDEYIATYRLADGATATTLPRQTYSGAGNGYTVFQPFDYRFNGAVNGKNYAELDTLSPTLPEADAALVKTLVIDNGITGGNNYSLAYMPSVTTVVLSSDFSGLTAGAFHGCTNLKTVFEAGKTATVDTIDLGSLETMTSLNWAFTDCNSIVNVKLPAAVSLTAAYGSFRNCYLLERVWLEGDEMPAKGTVDFGSAAAFKMNTDMLTNAYLINTLVCPDDTSFAAEGVLYNAVKNTGRDNPFSEDIDLNLQFTVGSAAQTAINAQLSISENLTVSVGLNGVAVTFDGDIEVDVGGLG